MKLPRVKWTLLSWQGEVWAREGVGGYVDGVGAARRERLSEHRSSSSSSLSSVVRSLAKARSLFLLAVPFPRLEHELAKKY